MRFWLALWGVCLLLQALYMSAWFSYLPGNDWWRLPSLALALAPLLQGVVLALAVAALIQEDSAADTDAYWRTLPVSPWPLLLVKLLFAMGFFVLAPVLVEGTVFLLHGFSMDMILAAGGEVAFRQLALVFLFAAVAALTSDLLRFGTWILLLIGGYAILLLVLATLEGEVRSSPVLFLAGGSGADVNPTLWAGMVLMVAGFAVVVLQYFTRRLRYGVSVAVLGAAGCLGAAHFFSAEEDASDGERPLAPAGVGNDLQRVNLLLGEAGWVSDGEDTVRAARVLRAPFEYGPGEEDRFIVAEQARTRLLAPNLATVEFDPVRQSEPTGLDLVRPAATDRWVDLLRIDRATYLAWRDRRGSLDTELLLWGGRFQDFAELELRESVVHPDQVDRLAIRKLAQGDGTFGIEVEVRRVQLLLVDDPRAGWRESVPGGEEIIFLLFNRETGETVPPSSRMVSPAVWPGLSRRLASERVSLLFGEPVSQEDDDESAPAEAFRDDAWMANAVLLCFRVSGVQSVSGRFVAEDFAFPEWD